MGRARIDRNKAVRSRQQGQQSRDRKLVAERMHARAATAGGDLAQQRLFRRRAAEQQAGFGMLRKQRATQFDPVTGWPGLVVAEATQPSALERALVARLQEDQRSTDLPGVQE